MYTLATCVLVGFMIFHPVDSLFTFSFVWSAIDNRQNSSGHRVYVLSVFVTAVGQLAHSSCREHTFGIIFTVRVFEQCVQTLLMIWYRCGNTTKCRREIYLISGFCVFVLCFISFILSEFGHWTVNVRSLTTQLVWLSPTISTISTSTTEISYIHTWKYVAYSIMHKMTFRLHLSFVSCQ